MQNLRDARKDVFQYYIDNEEPFDRVHHDTLVQADNQINIDEKDIQYIKNLFWNQKEKVRISEGNNIN